MNSIQLENILGYVANEHPLRASRDGKLFEGIIPAPDWSEIIVRPNGNVNDTVAEMKKLISRYSWQVAKLAPKLKGNDLYSTCKNVFDFLFRHIKYQEDETGKEQLRTPARSWEQRRSRGIDCDDFSIFAGCILSQLNIPFYIRIARYKGKDYFQHVYVVVPQTNKKYITIDAVLDEYDTEKPTIEHKDFLVMNNSNLNGVDISVLGAADDDTLNDLKGILSGADFNELEGFGDVGSREEELGAIRRHLQRTRRIVAKRPDFVAPTEQPEEFLGMVDYALRYWDTPKREEALGILAGEEDRMNILEGLGAYPETHEDVQLFYGLGDTGEYTVLGKAKKPRKFFAKVKQAVKKAGQGIKKIAKALVRFNPLTATIRAAVLLALKVNLLKVSSKLKWGYLTQEEAQSRGFDMEEWKKVKEKLAKAEGMFVKILQGKAENFKRAIINGRAGKLSGTDLGLGVVAAAATAASTTAAVPFITKIINLLKNINFKKLISKINVKKTSEESAQAEADVPTEEGGSAVPENDGSASTDDSGGGESSSGDEGGSSASEDANTGVEGETAPANKTESTNLPATTDPTETGAEENSNPGNLPAMRQSTSAAIKTTDSATNEGFITKATNWVKANPMTSVLVAGTTAFIIYQLLKPKTKEKPKPGLSGARKKGAVKKGKRKTNPPQTISGTGKKRGRKRKPKGKGRGKGGASKQVKL